MSLKSWLKFILLGIAWGSSFFWIKIGLQEVGPFTVVFFRIFFALIGLTVFFLLNRRKPLLKAWRLYLFLGVFYVALPFALVAWSEKYITSGLASILNSMQPLATSLIAAVFIQEERLNARRIAGLLLGFGGVLVLMSDKLSGEAINQIYGIIAMVAAVFCYGGSSVFARMHNQGVKPEDQAIGQFVFGILFIFPTMLAVESPFIMPVRPVSYLAFAWLGLIGSFFAAIAWYSLLDEIGPSRVSMTTYLFPLVGVLLGTILLHEAIDWRVIVGGLMILGGIVIVNSVKRNNQTPAQVQADSSEG